MKTFALSIENTPLTLPVTPRQSIRHALDFTAERVRSGCRGNGACGLCKIAIKQGSVSPPTTLETLHLTAEELENGVRLACQAYCLSDCTVTILNPAPQSAWRNVPSLDTLQQSIATFCKTTTTHNRANNNYAVAVDLGTTNVSLVLIDLTCNRALSSRTGYNPQHVYGSDVIHRLDSAVDSQHNAKALSELLLHFIEDGLLDISLREGFDMKAVSRVYIVGNTAMLSLFSGIGYSDLVNPERWDKYVDIAPSDTKRWIDTWRISQDASIRLIPPIAGFIGSDIRAGIITSGLMHHEIAALIDFGTNSEVALWVKDKLFCTSASGGPAFEGMGISCGMPAMHGAIYQVACQKGEWEYQTIENAKAEGVCASGLIDMIALLKEEGILLENGNFTGGVLKHTIPFNNTDVTLYKNDIDQLQRAKAAIATGLQIVCAHAGIESSDIQKLYIGGAFGYYLDIAHAKSIGLLPDLETSSVHIIGNSALEGCIKALLSETFDKQMHSLEAQIVNMSHIPEFGDLFMQNLYLCTLDELHA